MTIFWSDTQLEHRDAHFIQAGQIKSSPESVGRAAKIVEALLARGKVITRPRDLGLEPVLAVHSAEYVEFLRTGFSSWLEAFGPDAKMLPNVHPLEPYSTEPEHIIGKLGWFTGDMACEFTAGTWAAAYQSAQAAVNAASLTSSHSSAHYALCRPPGHHATSARAMGFCYLNNCAIAAKELRKRYDRVAILDVDVHHGNGQQQIFYESADVLTVSTHSHPKDYYPFYTGFPEERGIGEGEDCNLNIPYEFGAGDNSFLQAVDTALQSVDRFAPQALVLALGVDASEHDPHGRHCVTRAGFNEMAEKVRVLKLPTVIIQEGGYESDHVGDLIADVINTLER